jgi:Mrp family chromosome partitioning ATPase
MSYVDAALRRAMMEGILKATVLPQPAPDTGAAHRVFPSEGPGGLHGERPIRPPARTPDRRSDWELEAHLPAEAIPQLASLAEGLARHPSSPRIVGFASPGRGEGTSTCVAALGVYLASRHGALLVVDANHHSPTLHAIAGVDERPGLAELVAGEIDLAKAAQPTGLPELFVLASGDQDRARRNGMPVRGALQPRLRECAARFEIVLVDCPAVNPYGDAASIAAACDAVVLVVDGSRTKREAAQAAKAMLTRANCSIAGAFMNRRQFYIPQFLYDRL